MIRSAIAAAALTVLACQAQAATVHEYNIRLQYNGTSFRDARYAPADTIDWTESFNLPVGDTSVGFTSYIFPGLQTGDVTSFTATVIFPEDQDMLIDIYDNGGRADNCRLGPWDCSAAKMTYLHEDRVALLYSDLWMLHLDRQGGRNLSVTYNFGYYMTDYRTTDDGLYDYYYLTETSYFTITPIPLPASAALLPIGVGTLFLLRQRRRRNG